MLKTTALALVLATSLTSARAQVQTPADDLLRVAGPAIVREGDAIAVDGNPISLYGIDAPRLIQPCRLKGETWMCGMVARDALVDMIAGRAVECVQVRDNALRRRMLVFARCTVGGIDLGAAMVEAGMAMAFRDQSRDYLDIEAKAKAAKAGLWQAEVFEAPWLWDQRLTE